jgi:hypothetical protein
LKENIMSNKRPLRGFLTSSLTVAFLAVSAPTEAPAQSFDMMNPNNIMSPIHPLNPLTDPFGVWGTHDAPATADKPATPAPAAQIPSGKPLEASEGLSKDQMLAMALGTFALSMLAATGLAANAVSRQQKRRPQHPTPTPPHIRGGGGDF